MTRVGHLSPARWVVSALILAPLFPTNGALFAQTAPRQDEELGELATGRMHALLERTFLRVDVLTLDLCFDRATARAIAEALAPGSEDSDAVEDAVAEAALGASEAVGVLEFKRGITLEQFLEGVSEDHVRAVEAGFLADSTRQALQRALPRWYEFLANRRILEGDQIRYRFFPDSVRTTFVGAGGETLLDRVSVGRERRASILGAYFAPGGSLRDRLIESAMAGDAKPSPILDRCRVALQPSPPA